MNYCTKCKGRVLYYSRSDIKNGKILCVFCCDEKKKVIQKECKGCGFDVFNESWEQGIFGDWFCSEACVREYAGINKGENE